MVKVHSTSVAHGTRTGRLVPGKVFGSAVPLLPLPFVRYVTQLWNNEGYSKKIQLVDTEGDISGRDICITRDEYRFTLAGVQEFGKGGSLVLRNVPAGMNADTGYPILRPSSKSDLSIHVTALSTRSDALAPFIEEEYEPLIYGAYVLKNNQGKEMARPLSGRKRIRFYRGDVINLPVSDKRGNSVETDMLCDGTLYGILIPRIRYSGELEQPAEDTVTVSETNRRLKKRRIAQQLLTDNNSTYAWNSAVPFVIEIASTGANTY